MIPKGALFGMKKSTLDPWPCVERCLLIRAALTQRPFARVFDASLDALPLVSVLVSQPQCAEA